MLLRCMVCVVDPYQGREKKEMTYYQTNLILTLLYNGTEYSVRSTEYVNHKYSWPNNLLISFLSDNLPISTPANRGIRGYTGNPCIRT